MRTIHALIILGTMFLVTGCCKNETTTEEVPTATVTVPTPTVAPAENRFGGVYSSNWGTTTFVENGPSITARYPRGTMTCTAAGDVLTCDWAEGSATGKALLTRKANGDLSGSWGKGSSATNGGSWNFTRKGDSSASDSATTFDGPYKSNWGTTTFTQTGSTVKATYPKGRMTCVATGHVLNCDWYEGGERGRARLVKNADGSITGTWGKGTSAANGGPWRFTPM